MLAWNIQYGQKIKDSVNQLEEVVITATKFTLAKEKVGKIIYRISPDEIENSKGKTVSEVLDAIASISINGTNSAQGKNKSIFIRGGRNHQVLIMIDGVPVGDPSGISTTFDLRFLTLNQIESIEVMNGAASTLYGSGAGTGIVNIILKKALNVPIAFTYQGSIGTNNDANHHALDISDSNHHIALSGSSEKFNYILNTNFAKTDGLSEAASGNANEDFESDAFKALNTFAKIGYQASERLTMNLTAAFDKDTYDYDGGAYVDSQINNGENKQYRYGFSSDYKYKKGSFKINISLNKVDRMFDSYNGWTDAIDNFEYVGKTTFIDAFNKYEISRNLQLITGLNYVAQDNQTNSPYGNIDSELANFSNVDPYLTFLFNSDSGFNLSTGLRLNEHSEYGSHWVYHLNPSYNFSSTFKALGSVSTAYITPSPYQLFSQYGNSELEPESSNNIEAGFEFSKPNSLQLSGLFFYREEKDAILLPDFVKYQNSTEKLIARGFESKAKIMFSQHINISLTHTYTNKSSDLDYIPKNKFAATLNVRPIDKTRLSIQFSQLSKRSYFDQWGSGETISIDGYGLLDLFVSHRLIKNKLDVFLRCSNVFNEEYVETLGYSTKGRNYKLGIVFSL